MQGEIEAYFRTLGAFGARIEASERSGERLPLGAAAAKALEAARCAQRDKARVFFIGNGGSAGICSHQATDWMRN